MRPDVIYGNESVVLNLSIQFRLDFRQAHLALDVP